MEKKYKLVIFDLDGTLLDTSEGIMSALKDVIKSEGLEMADDKVLRTFIGPAIRKSFSRVYGINEEVGIVLQNKFRKSYIENHIFKAEPYFGMLETLKKLKEAGLNTGVATYKGEEQARFLLAEKGFSKYLNFIIGDDSKGKIKKPDMIRYCAEQSNIKNMSEVVMIGDSEYDAQGAAEAGCDFIACTYGFGFEPDKKISYPFVAKAERAEDIADIVLGNC